MNKKLIARICMLASMLLLVQDAFPRGGGGGGGRGGGGGGRGGGGGGRSFGGGGGRGMGGGARVGAGGGTGPVGRGQPLAIVGAGPGVDCLGGRGGGEGQAKGAPAGAWHTEHDWFSSFRKMGLARPGSLAGQPPGRAGADCSERPDLRRDELELPEELTVASARTGDSLDPVN